VLAVALVVTAGCIRLFRRRLGGVTGDTLGAACQLVEVAAVGAVAALVNAGWV
jgi:cobalamin synthase